MKSAKELLLKAKSKGIVKSLYLDEKLVDFIEKEAKRNGSKFGTLVTAILLEWAKQNGLK